MPASADIQQPRGARRNRTSELPTCTVCAASMIAAEASAWGPDNKVRYLWSCDVCGYGFVTDQQIGVQPN
jgi:hypothetical protein